MMRGMTILWTVLAVIIGIGLFLLKYQVKALEGQLVQVNRDIRTHQEAIHVLKAEWSFLNDPERLRDLTERYLAMKPFRGEQMVQIADLAMAPPRPDAEPQPEPAPQPAPEGRALEARAPDSHPSEARRPEARVAEARAPEARVVANASPTQPVQPAPLTRRLHLKPVEKLPVATPAKPAAPAAPAKTERTVVASASVAKPMPLKTETTSKPIVTKAEPVRSEALRTAFASAKPANPRPVVTTPPPSSVPRSQPAKLPTGGVVTSAPSADVMVIKSPALIAAEAAARGQR